MNTSNRLIGAMTALVFLSSCIPAMTAEEHHEAASPDPANPYNRQVARQIEKLTSPSPKVRAAGAEALGFLRAYSAADELVRALTDETPAVGREAAMALGWCGGRDAVEPLIGALDAEDWVVAQAAACSLGNLTGMEFPFDAFTQSELRNHQIAVWRQWCTNSLNNSAPGDRPPGEILQLARSKDDESRLRAVRALGAIGGKGASRAVVKVLLPFRQRNYRQLSPLEKHLVQSCIRSLGRLRDEEAFPVLLSFLDTADWARYAADALGDFGDPRAVGPLIALYPKVSRNLNQRTKNPQICPADDRYSGDNTQDRMHETPYAIALALTRLPLDDPRHRVFRGEGRRAALREIVPYLLANLPSNWDGGVLYEPESFELITAYLLDRAGLRQAACDAAFQAAAESDRWLLSKSLSGK